MTQTVQQHHHGSGRVGRARLEARQRDAAGGYPVRPPGHWVAVAAALLGIGLLVTGCYGGGGPGRRIDGTGGPASLAGAPAVSFDLPRLDGGVDSLARHRGAVVLMNFWATWCPPCKEEMPALEALAREDRGRGLVVLGIDQGESADAARAFARAHRITFPILLDADQKYASSYVSIGLPTTVIIGRDGRVVRGIDGAQTLAQFRTALAPALAAR